MRIEEKDLFYYVFHRELLSGEKQEYIDSNLYRFGESIRFLEDYKREFYNVPAEQVEKLTQAVLKKADKLSSENGFFITLYKKEGNFLSSSNVKLAADSVQMSKTSGVETFSDTNSNYLIKVMYGSEETKIFVIERDYNTVQNFELIIYPGEKSYHFEDNKNPLVINEVSAIEKIDMIIN